MGSKRPEVAGSPGLEPGLDFVLGIGLTDSLELRPPAVELTERRLTVQIVEKAHGIGDYRFGFRRALLREAP